MRVCLLFSGKYRLTIRCFDLRSAGAATVPGWRVVEGDIAGEALARISQRVAEVRAGVLRLNRTGDREFFEKKAGLTPYALDKSPLIDFFSLPDEEQEAGEEAS